jgi:hypothetical protein
MFRVEEDTIKARQPEILESHFQREVFVSMTPDEKAAFEKLRETPFWKALVEGERQRRESSERQGTPDQNTSKKYIIDTSRHPNRIRRI